MPLLKVATKKKMMKIGDEEKQKHMSILLRPNLALIISYGCILSHLLDFLETNDILAIDDACHNGSKGVRLKVRDAICHTHRADMSHTKRVEDI